MKKSDLINLLDVELNEYHMDLADGEITYSDFNNNIISIIENAGMLPPHILNKSVEEDLTPFEEIIFRDDYILDIDCHIWHPEREDTDELPEV